MQQMKMTAQQIAANMTKGKWVVGTGSKSVWGTERPEGFNAIIANTNAAARDSAGCESNTEAIVSAVNGTYGQNLDPEQYAPIVEAFISAISIIEYMEIMSSVHYTIRDLDTSITKFKHLLSAAIINPKTTTND